MNNIQLVNNRFIINPRHCRYEFKNKIGKMYNTKYGQCQIIGYHDNTHVTIKFITTGYTCKTSIGKLNENKFKPI